MIYWLKSRTTWDVLNLVNNGIYYLSTGAGFLPSTVSIYMECNQFTWKITLVEKYIIPIAHEFNQYQCLALCIHMYDHLSSMFQSRPI